LTNGVTEECAKCMSCDLYFTYGAELRQHQKTDHSTSSNNDGMQAEKPASALMPDEFEDAEESETSTIEEPPKKRKKRST